MEALENTEGTDDQHRNRLFEVTTSYEATKGAATLLLQGLSRNFNIPSIILRPYSIYGPMENASRLIPTIFRHFLFNENLKIYNGYHDFVYIDDVEHHFRYLQARLEG